MVYYWIKIPVIVIEINSAVIILSYNSNDADL